MKSFRNIDKERLTFEYYVATGITRGYFNYTAYDVVVEIIKYVKENKNNNDGTIGRPDLDYGVEGSTIATMVWSMCVYNFGDYGTSPRSGWIENKNANECIEFLKYLIHDAIEYKEVEV